jgi:hypothetical protein
MGADALLTRIDESDAQKLLTAAQWHLRMGDAIAAELTIRRLVHAHPRSVAAAEAMRLIETLLPRLPEAVLEEGPDYEALRRAILGTSSQKLDPDSPGDGTESESPGAAPPSAAGAEERP